MRRNWKKLLSIEKIDVKMVNISNKTCFGGNVSLYMILLALKCFINYMDWTDVIKDEAKPVDKKVHIVIDKQSRSPQHKDSRQESNLDHGGS